MSEPIYAYRHRRRTAKNSGCLTLCVLLLGIGLSFIFWPVGIPVCLIALVLDGQRSTFHICGSCGNPTSPTSTLCPTCHAHLIREPFWTARRQRMCLTILALVGIAGIACTIAVYTAQR